MKRSDFMKEVAKYCVTDYKRSKVLPSLTIAQAILESGWGQSGLAKNSKNLFGIKAGKSWKGAKRSYPTKEFYDGKWVTIQAYFREYPTFEGSIKDHNDLLQNKRYEKVLTAKDYKEATHEIWKAGYATDPNYPKLLNRIIEQFKLNQYDTFDLNQETKKKEDDKMNLKQNEWEILEKEIKNLLDKKVLNNNQWLEKAQKRTLTISELTFLNTIIISRTLK